MPDYNNTLDPQQIADYPSHVQLQGQTGAICLNHDYLEPSTIQEWVLRKECIYNHTLHHSTKLCGSNEFKVIETLLSETLIRS